LYSFLTLKHTQPPPYLQKRLSEIEMTFINDRMSNDEMILFRLSLGDLAAARCLYKKGHYRQSYFMFQQASEKANKGFVVLAGEVKQQDVKKFWHGQIGIYKTLTEKKKKEIGEIKEAFASYPHTQTPALHALNFNAHYDMIENALKEFTLLEKKKTDTFTVRELSELIRELKEIENIPFVKPRNIKANLKKYFIQLAEWSGEFGTPSSLTSKKELLEMVNDKKKLQEISDYTFDVTVLLMQIAFSQFTLLICALLTNNHSTSTRYAEGSFDPDKVYTNKLPIVKKQEQFMNLLEKAINRIILIAGKK